MFIGGVLVVGWLTNTLRNDIKRHQRNKQPSPSRVISRPQSSAMGGITTLSKPSSPNRNERVDLPYLNRSCVLPKAPTTKGLPQHIQTKRNMNDDGEISINFDIPDDVPQSRTISTGYVHSSSRSRSSE